MHVSQGPFYRPSTNSVNELFWDERLLRGCSQMEVIPSGFQKKRSLFPFSLSILELIHWKGCDVRPNTVKGHSITDQDDLLDCYAKDIELNPPATPIQSVRSAGGSDSWEIRAWSLLWGSVCPVYVCMFTGTTVLYPGPILQVSLQS